MSDAEQVFRSVFEYLQQHDPQVADAIKNELGSQRRTLKLIASENYASAAVMLAMANWLNDKYAEGSIGRRMYAGCENVDRIEEIAADRACDLFGAEHAYTQPHSGADANLVAFWAILRHRIEVPYVDHLGAGKNIDELDDTSWAELRSALGNQRLMGMALDAGGHLTHGFRRNVSGKMFDQRTYSVDTRTGRVDYDQIRDAAREFKPLVLLAGYSAYPRLIDYSIMREIADEVGATLMADMAHIAGLVAGNAINGKYNPVAYADIVTTTTHKSLRGPRGGLVLCTREYADSVEKGCPLILGGPLPHVIAAKAVSFQEAVQPEFSIYARLVIDNARALAGSLTENGIPVLTGGTDNHIVLLDASSTCNLTGRQAESALSSIGITANRNMIPNDPHGPWYTSGIRLGTPAVSTLGMAREEMHTIGTAIAECLQRTRPDTKSRARFTLDTGTADSCRKLVAELTARFRPYDEIGELR